MLDVTAVGADLTPEQQDETIADLSFFLDEFGSTQAVRAKLKEQESVIQRLLRDESSQDENDRNGDEMSLSIGIAEQGVDQTMADLDFFLKTFGSTRAVKEKLQNQQLEITKLQSATRDVGRDGHLSEKSQARSGEVKGGGPWSGCEVGSGETKEEPGGNASVELGKVTQFGDVDASEWKEGGPAPSKAPAVALDSLVCGRKQRADQEGRRRAMSSTAFMNDAVVVAYCATLERAKEMCAALQASGATSNGDIVQLNSCSATCKAENCYRKAGGDSLCWFHGRTRRCGFGGCEKLARLHGKGFCTAHACQQDAKPKCIVEGCNNTQQRPDYCMKHYKHNLGRRQASAARRDGDTRYQTNPNRSGAGRGHVTCKVIGCMKWVMRNGNESKYCSRHRDAFELHDVEAELQARHDKSSARKPRGSAAYVEAPGAPINGRSQW